MPLPSSEGRSGVARLGLGLAAVGRPGYITLGRDSDLPADRSPAALEERAHALLDAATAAGIRYVDAARSYGRAEHFLASWLRGSAAEPFVASKWGYRYTAGWRIDTEHHEVKDHSRRAFERQWAETRDLIGPGCGSTRCTCSRSTVPCGPTARCSPNWRRCGRAAWSSAARPPDRPRPTRSAGVCS